MHAAAAKAVATTAVVAKVAAPVIRYKLEGFSHLYDVGVGVNLAYSILEQAHKSWVKKCEGIMAENIRRLVSLAEPGSEQASAIGTIVGVERKKLKSVEATSNVTVNIFRMWGFLAAAILMAILGYVGFFPESAVSFSACVWIIILLIIPVPISALGLFLYLKRKERALNRQLDDCVSYIEDEKKAAIAAIKAKGP